MSITSYLLKGLPKKIPTNRVNTEIRKELVLRFPDKYISSSSIGSVKTKQRGNITTQDLANDITTIVKEDKPEWNISEPDIRLAKRPIGLSGKYLTIFFTINGREEKFVLRGEQKAQATSTPINVKECLVCYFFKSAKKYNPFRKTSNQKTKENNYFSLLEKLINDIKHNGISGCKIKDVQEVINFLEHESNKYNLDFINSVFNSMSIGNYLRETKFANWNVERGEFFDYIKNIAGKEILGYTNTDKWCPMDIVLYKPGYEQEIKNILEKTKEENLDTQLIKVNNLFINDLNENNPDAIILGISLKEQIAQAGKAKGYIKKLEPKFGNTYNLSTDETKRYKDKEWLGEMIVNYRKNIKNIVDSNIEMFKYELTNGDIDEYDMDNEPIKKYATLKMVSYILSASTNDKNIFTNILKYGLSMESNPSFFKLKGNIEGDPNKVEREIEKYPPTGNVKLYNSKTNKFGGKILIKDSNKNKGINLEYYVQFNNIIYFSKVSIRPNQSSVVSQVTIEISNWDKYKSANEFIID